MTLLAFETTHKDGTKSYRLVKPDPSVCFARIVVRAHQRAELAGEALRLVGLSVADEVSPIDVHPDDCRDTAAHETP